MSSKYLAVQYFFAETSHTSPTCQCLQNDVQDFFILLLFWVICKKLKRLGFYAIVFYVSINSSRSKQNKKIPNTIL